MLSSSSQRTQPFADLRSMKERAALHSMKRELTINSNKAPAVRAVHAAVRRRTDASDGARRAARLGTRMDELTPFASAGTRLDRAAGDTGPGPEVLILGPTLRGLDWAAVPWQAAPAIPIRGRPPRCGV